MSPEGALLKPVPKASERIRGVGNRARKGLGIYHSADLVDDMRKEDEEEL